MNPSRTSTTDDVDLPIQDWPNPRRGLLFFLGFAAIGAGMAQLVPAVLTLSLKAEALDHRTATTILSVVVAVGAVVALVSAPVLGRLSDRITWRTGRRRPLLVLGAVLFAIGAPVSYAAPGTGLLILGNAFTWLGTAAVTVACTATLADQYAPNRRGPASALVGLSLPVGAVVGLFLAQLVSGSLLAQFLIPAAVGVLSALLLAVRLPERAIAKADVPPFRPREFFGTFWVDPVAHPSFGWAWWSRLLIFFGIAAVQAYQAFYLILALHFTLQSVANAVFLSTLVLTVMALVFAPIAGKLSDRIGRRKPFVVVAAVVFAVGLVVVTFATTYPAFLVAMAIIGLGQGVYMAVDLALVSEILPDRHNIAKDMGIMGLASSLPASIVPAVAPVLLAIGASAAHPQNFPALFFTGAVAGLLGAALILPIRGVD
ncbi:MAG TPA: MFS transporter [Microbacterium sp.]|uniref:MFS transporter n=1 Tax=Microbacterium sp. TaxID=51671 RepID=UPI002B49E4AD|nr:MFS transporter [Microbacterium sp.]HKT55606.1 MFS transporter [Microbacterium sp.]